jgi:hypothetical protein
LFSAEKKGKCILYSIVSSRTLFSHEHILRMSAVHNDTLVCCILHFLIAPSRSLSPKAVHAQSQRYYVTSCCQHSLQKGGEILWSGILAKECFFRQLPSLTKGSGLNNTLPLHIHESEVYSDGQLLRNTKKPKLSLKTV